MNRRRLLLLGLGVTALLAVAAIASSGRPLARSHAAGPSASFFDYVFTTTAIFYIAMTLIVIYALIVQKRIPFEAPKRRWRLLSTFASLLLVGVVVLIAMHNGLGQRIRDLNLRANPQQAGKGTRPGAENKLGRNAHLRWDEIAVVLALIAGTGVLLYVGKGAKRTPRPWRVRSKEAVSLALDESLDDLRNERDLRRAIIAAYARMEHALAVSGIPRRPSEAPFEYVERALGELETSAASARRLTDLFEWAKFSHHEPGPEMRDEAIEALVAVRDELRRPAVGAVA